MNARDYKIGGILATIIGALLAPILARAELIEHASLLLVVTLAVGMTIATCIGLWIAGALSRWLTFLPRLARYGLTGVFNTVFDLCVFTSLAFLFGVYQGWTLAFLNIVSFSLTVVISYFINRSWAFASGNLANVREFGLFIGVNVSSMMLNTSLVYTLTTVTGAPESFSAEQWVTIVKIVSILVSFAWNFTFFHFLVFKKPRPQTIPGGQSSL